MFESIRSNRRIVQVILGLIVLTFAFFGIESYLGSIGTDASIATVGETKIGPAEFENALRRQQDEIRKQTGGQVELAQLNTPEIREAVLESLVNQRLLALYAADSRLSVPTEQMREVIASIEEFQQDGQFSRGRYEQVLRSEGLSEAAFEQQLRRDVAFQQITTAVGNSAIAARKSARALLALQLEERTVALAKIPADPDTPGIEVSDAQIAEHFERNAERFRVPARVKAEYLVLDRAKLAERIEIDEQEVRRWYDEHPDRYRQDEERRARHILIELPADAADAAVAEARAKAESVLTRLRADGGASFDALARAESQDPGSADKGGDLGFFARGMMVKAFDDAVFALPQGEISGAVRSDFGWHIIQVTEIRPAKARPFDEVREAIAAELREQRVQREFAHAAETFSNLVYEQPDSLQPAAQQFGLQLETSDWVSRDAAAPAPFDNPRIVAALFSADALERKLNTEVVDLGEDRLVAARVAAHEAARSVPLEAVREQLRAELRAEAAARRAEERGRALIAALDKGESVDLTFAGSKRVGRRSAEVDPLLLRAIFGAAANASPAHGGARNLAGDYVVFRVEAVHAAEISDDDARLAGLRTQYERLLAERDLKAFLAELRRKYGVEINRSALQAVAS